MSMPERMRREYEALRRGDDCPCRDDHASWCPIGRIERLTEAIERHMDGASVATWTDRDRLLYEVLEG